MCERPDCPGPANTYPIWGPEVHRATSDLGPPYVTLERQMVLRIKHIVHRRSLHGGLSYGNEAGNEPALQIKGRFVDLVLNLADAG
jgi:hypothetical protein